MSTFERIPLRVSGNSVVAHVSGEVKWSLNGKKIKEVMLKSEDGGLVEITPDDEIWDVVCAALKKEPLQQDAVELSSEPYSPAIPVLDNADEEGAQKTPG